MQSKTETLSFLLYNLATRSFFSPLIYSVFCFFQNYRKLLVGKWYFALDFCDLYANYMILNAKVNEIYACKREWEF